MRTKLNNKSILITAGPTWVAIDKVRVISNIATGLTGLSLANEAKNKGAKVTLILGPVGFLNLNGLIKVYRFKYFQELRLLMRQELSRKRYDVVIHSAAVSDYRPQNTYRGKFSSSKKRFCVRLRPVPKLFTQIRRLQPEAKLVIFKFEPGAKDAILKTKAADILRKAGADLVVANKSSSNSYKAFIIDKKNITLACANRKEALARKLISIIEARL